MSYFVIALATLLAYLMGSLSSAVIVCKIMGLPDPRTQGSKNPGATNVLRIGGKKAAIITLLGDVLKGVIPVLVAKLMGLDSLGLSLVAFGAFIGHLYPVFFDFIGGKGVATAIGCILVLSFPAGICWLVTWLVMAILFRYSSLSSLTAAFLAPVYSWYFTNDFYITFSIALMSLILIIRHKSNIQKLLSGKETKIGKK